MMVQTVASGSAFKSFHDARPVEACTLAPGVQVAGKTGTLTDHAQDRHYTWFVGFAPSEEPEVAVSVLVVNTPIWQVKAADIARDVLRAYFARPWSTGHYAAVARRPTSCPTCVDDCTSVRAKLRASGPGLAIQSPDLKRAEADGDGIHGRKSRSVIWSARWRCTRARWLLE